jgi:very-short-patch-repair endonuclease
MQKQSTPTAQRHARTLRHEMTDSERKLWSGLRGEQMGVKFRRQHPLGNYIVDFACLTPKLIVELDGSQHAVQQAYDARRDAPQGARLCSPAFSEQRAIAQPGRCAGRHF